MFEFFKKTNKEFDAANPGAYTAKIIKEIKQEGHPIIVKTTANGPEYLSLIIEEFPESNCFLLDELSPTSGHEQITVGSKLFLSTISDGIPVHFHTKVEKIGEKNGIFYYKLNNPHSIEFTQRRTDFRIKIPKDLHLKVEFSLPRIPLHSAKILDISFNGMRIVASHNLTKILKVGDVIADIRINLPEAELTNIEFEARFLQYNNGQITTLIGGKFKKMSKQNEKHISNFIVKHQRQQLQRNSRLK